MLNQLIKDLIGLRNSYKKIEREKNVRDMLIIYKNNKIGICKVMFTRHLWQTC